MIILGYIQHEADADLVGAVVWFGFVFVLVMANQGQQSANSKNCQ